MIETALEQSLTDPAVRLEGEQIVWAAMARRTARLVDLAWKADDVSAVLRGTAHLRELMDLLPLRPAPAGEPGGGNHDGGSPRGQVLALLDGPARVGDTS